MFDSDMDVVQGARPARHGNAKTELSMRRTLLLIAINCWAIIVLALSGCTDGATRLAGELRDAAAQLRSSGASHSVMTHTPSARPEGCESAYSLLLAQQSSIVIWCRPTLGAEPTGSYSTTYHLNFLQVPERFAVEKRQGEPTVIDLEMRGGIVVVASVR
jgi:hypothetical protein